MALCKLKNWILKISRKTLKKMRIQKNFSRKNFKSGRIWTPPRYHYIGSKTKTAFLTNFTKFSWNLGWKIENDLYLSRLVSDAGSALSCADPFADLSRIGGILHTFRIYRLAGWASWSFAMLRQSNTGRTSPGVFLVDLVQARLQNFRAQKLKDIASEYLRMWTRTTPTEPRKPCKTYKYTYRYN